MGPLPTWLQGAEVGQTEAGAWNSESAMWVSGTLARRPSSSGSEVKRLGLEAALL